MSQETEQVCWTEDQWNLVRKTVAEEAQRARVAAQFLPLFGPVDAAAVSVPDLRLRQSVVAPPAIANLSVNSAPRTFLANIEVQVSLAKREMADPELSAALTMFRRAAGYVARVEDALIFNGQPGRGLPPRTGVAGIPRVWRVTSGGRQDGILPWISRGMLLTPPPIRRPRVGSRIRRPRGSSVINALIRAITRLEGRGHSGPYACVLAPDLFGLVCAPTASMVLPRDRILPFLDGGSLFRTSAVPNGFGVVVALGGSPIELVVARDVSVRYLQTTLQPRAVFRVSERVVLRIKEMGSIAVLYY